MCPSPERATPPLALALAESLHHSAQRPKMARAWREAREVLRGHVPEAPLPQGSQPPCLGEPRKPQDKLTFLVSPVLQNINQLVAVLARYDTPLPEQVIEVPKISCPPRFSRTVLLTPLMAEQPVVVPLPETGVVQAWVCDASGQRWSRVWRSTGRIYWWHPATGHVQWNPGRYINTGQG